MDLHVCIILLQKSCLVLILPPYYYHPVMLSCIFSVAAPESAALYTLQWVWEME